MLRHGIDLYLVRDIGLRLFAKVNIRHGKMDNLPAWWMVTVIALSIGLFATELIADSIQGFKQNLGKGKFLPVGFIY